MSTPTAPTVSPVLAEAALVYGQRADQLADLMAAALETNTAAAEAAVAAAESQLRGLAETIAEALTDLVESHTYTTA